MEMLDQRDKPDISFVHEIVEVGFYRYFIHNFGIMNIPSMR